MESYNTDFRVWLLSRPGLLDLSCVVAGPALHASLWLNRVPSMGRSAPRDGRVGCSRLLVVVNRAAVNMRVHILV